MRECVRGVFEEKRAVAPTTTVECMLTMRGCCSNITFIMLQVGRVAARWCAAGSYRSYCALLCFSEGTYAFFLSASTIFFSVCYASRQSAIGGCRRSDASIAGWGGCCTEKIVLNGVDESTEMRPCQQSGDTWTHHSNLGYNSDFSHFTSRGHILSGIQRVLGVVHIGHALEGRRKALRGTHRSRR